MKNLFKLSLLAICTAMISAGCTGIKYFYQVGHVKSVDGSVVKDGSSLTAQANDVELSYDFWDEYGKVAFVISNNADRDLIVHMDRSFFIRNGVAYDYFNDMRYSSNSTDSYSSASTVGSAYSFAGYGSARSLAVSSTGVSSSTRSSSVEYPEKLHVIVPAKSSKIISKFEVTDFMYRSCDLFLYKFEDRKDEQSVYFDKENSPLNFENRLVCSFDGSDQLFQFSNKFFVDEITNMKENAFRKAVNTPNCPDEQVYTTSTSTTSVPRAYRYVMLDVDTYYIKYTNNTYAYPQKH